MRKTCTNKYRINNDETVTVKTSLLLDLLSELILCSLNFVLAIENITLAINQHSTFVVDISCCN